LEGDLIGSEKEPRKRIPREVDQKERQRRQEGERRLDLLNPDADGAAVGIDQFIFGIGMKKGEAGEKKKVDRENDPEQGEEGPVLLRGVLRSHVRNLAEKKGDVKELPYLPPLL
jgi:hypothetical protein